MKSPTDEGSTYRCARCSSPALPPIEDLARAVSAAVARGAADPAAWWQPLTGWEVFQAEAVAWLRHGDLRCHYHAALLAAIVVDLMRRAGQAEPVERLGAGG